MHIQSLHTYPIKSLRGTTLPTTNLTPHGFPHDRVFVLLRDHGKDESKNPLKSGRWEHLSIAKQPELGLFVCGVEWARRGKDGGERGDGDVDLGTREDGVRNGVAETAHSYSNLNGDSDSDISSSSDDDTDTSTSTDILTITHTHPSTHITSTLRIPLHPPLTHLQTHPITLKIHQSPTTALLMPSHFSEWFSKHLGYEVHLAYLGEDNYRPVLGNIAPNASVRNPALQRAKAAEETARAEAEIRRSWIQRLGAGLPGISSVVASTPLARTDTDPSAEADPAADKDPGYEITFADCSPYMIVNAASFENVAARFPADEEPLEIEKFRPNIVVGGEGVEAFEEDFWGELDVFGGQRDKGCEGGMTFQLTANCVRCTSLNVDWKTGKFGTSAKGNVLKTLARDRRVDKGHRYSPVFGRYGFLVRSDQRAGVGRDGVDGGGATGRDRDGSVRDMEKQGSMRISVGDKVEVTRRNEERTVFRWPGIGQTKKDDLYPVGDVQGVPAA